MQNLRNVSISVILVAFALKVSLSCRSSAVEVISKDGTVTPMSYGEAVLLFEHKCGQGDTVRLVRRWTDGEVDTLDKCPK